MSAITGPLELRCVLQQTVNTPSLQLALKVEAVLMPINQTTRSYISEDCNPQKSSTCTRVQRAYTEEVMSHFMPTVRMFQFDDRLPDTNRSAVAFHPRDAFLKTSHKSKLE